MSSSRIEQIIEEIEIILIHAKDLYFHRETRLWWSVSVWKNFCVNFV